MFSFLTKLGFVYDRKSVDGERTKHFYAIRGMTICITFRSGAMHSISVSYWRPDDFTECHLADVFGIFQRDRAFRFLSDTVARRVNEVDQSEEEYDLSLRLCEALNKAAS